MGSETEEGKHPRNVGVSEECMGVTLDSLSVTATSVRTVPQSPVQILPYLLPQKWVRSILITLPRDPLGLPFQRNNLPEDTGLLPHGTLVSAGVVGHEGAGQVI